MFPGYLIGKEEIYSFFFVFPRVMNYFSPRLFPGYFRKRENCSFFLFLPTIFSGYLFGQTSVRTIVRINSKINGQNPDLSAGQGNDQGGYEFVHTGLTE